MKRGSASGQPLDPSERLVAGVVVADHADPVGVGLRPQRLELALEQLDGRLVGGHADRDRGVRRSPAPRRAGGAGAPSGTRTREPSSRLASSGELERRRSVARQRHDAPEDRSARRAGRRARRRGSATASPPPSPDDARRRPRAPGGRIRSRACTAAPWTNSALPAADGEPRRRRRPQPDGEPVRLGQRLSPGLAQHRPQAR